MKVLFFVLASLVTLNVCAGRAADEKQTAIAEIKKKLQEVIDIGKQVTTAAQIEKANTLKSTGEAESLKLLTTKTNVTKDQFEEDARAVIRTAIVKSKPISVFYCVRNVTFFGHAKILDVSNVNHKKVLEIKTKKLQKIGFDEYAAGAIISGLNELVIQSITKINEASGIQIQTFKKEALDNCNSALLLLEEIELYINDPILSKEYTKMRQEMDRSLGGVKKDLNTDLDNCLTAK